MSKIISIETKSIHLHNEQYAELKDNLERVKRQLSDLEVVRANLDRCRLNLELQLERLEDTISNTIIRYGANNGR